MPPVPISLTRRLGVLAGVLVLTVGDDRIRVGRLPACVQAARGRARLGRGR